MRVLLIGGSGLIGRSFARLLLEQGDEVWLLTRNLRRASMPGVQCFGWDGQSPQGWSDLMERVDAVVNLAGENIGQERWSPERKIALRTSRLNTCQAVAQAFLQAQHRPKVLLQASAVGYYGLLAEQMVDEKAPAGTDFLAQLSADWEQATQPVADLDVRRILIRTGVVLDAQEGMLPRFVTPFRYYAGGPMGSGAQWISWIHMRDQVAAMAFLLKQESASGPYNLTAPGAVTNADFGRTLARVLRRPYWAPVPEFVLRQMLGEMSVLVLGGQRVIPRRLQRAGFRFQFETLQPALEDLLLPKAGKKP